MNYIELTEKLVNRSLRLGADAAEVYLQTSRNLSVRVRNADIETVQEAAARGVGFRVFVDGKMGFSHCNDFSDRALEDTIKRAVAFARLTSPDENNVLPVDMPHVDIDGMYDPGIIEVPMDTKIQMALDLERMAMQDPRITHSSGASFGEGESEVFIGNSNGLLKSRKQSACSVGVSVVAEKGDERNTGGESSSRRFFRDLEDLEEIAAKASQKAWEMLDPRMVRTQRAAVIFDPAVGRSLLGGIIAAISGDRVNQGASFLGNRLGQQFATNLLTIIDDGTRPGGMSSTPFDGEGVPTRRTVLVDKGVVRNFIYNSQAAKRAGVESTGHASRGGFTGLPGIGTHNLWVEAGQYSPEQIIANTTRGLLLKGVTGYGMNPVNGNYSGGATGFWIENGKIVHPVKGLTIAGSADSILNGIDMVGNDIDMTRSFTSPTIRVREMQIGGA
jgi:PmbA protein